MFGKKKAVRKQVSKMSSIMDSSNAPKNLSAESTSKMGVLAMKYDATLRDYNDSSSSKSAKQTLKSLKQIEKEAKKVLRK